MSACGGSCNAGSNAKTPRGHTRTCRALPTSQIPLQRMSHMWCTLRTCRRAPPPAPAVRPPRRQIMAQPTAEYAPPRMLRASPWHSRKGVVYNSRVGPRGVGLKGKDHDVWGRRAEAPRRTTSSALAGVEARMAAQAPDGLRRTLCFTAHNRGRGIRGAVFF